MNVFKRKLFECECRSYVFLGLLLLALLNCGIVLGATRNVVLLVEPPAVRRQQHVTLKCTYDLKNAPLYSVKFYRGSLEFYRFSPGELPHGKVFPFPGINVDLSLSNASQVVIRNVGFGLTGNFSCEVTADAPYFSTATAYAYMQVVEYPEKRPMLFTEQNRYEPGDVLRANCSTLPSRPKAELKFTINNIVVNTQETQYIPTKDNLFASRLSLKLQLQAIHFQTGVAMSHLSNSIYASDSRASGGALVLRCTAQIGNLYQEYREIELGVPQRDPVPARVTHSSAESLQNFVFKIFSSSSSPARFSSLESRLMTISLTTALIGAFHWLQSHTR
ncbi:hypothetical protein ACFFRR_006330 [Megaselia abdita]